MPQRTATTAGAIRRANRSYARLHGRGTVVRKRHWEAFRSRWIEPTVIYVVGGGDAWSAFLKRTMAAKKVNVSELARRSGLHRTTISEWINHGAGAITIQSVYLVADALEVDRLEALRAAGGVPNERDPEVDLILASNRGEREKAMMIDRLMRRREEERQRRIEDLKFALGEDDSEDQRDVG